MYSKVINSCNIKHLQKQGVVYLRNLPLTLDWIKYLEPIGKPMANKYSKSPVHTIQPQTEFSKRSFSLSFNALNHHTEAPYLDPPPRYIALWGVKPAACGGGATSFVDGYAMIESLPKPQQHWLHHTSTTFPVVDAHGHISELGSCVPILEIKSDHRPILRFSYNLFSFSDYNATLLNKTNCNNEMLDILDHSVSYYQKHATSITLESGDLLVLDNHRMLHARSAFKDPDRRLDALWLK